MKINTKQSRLIINILNILGIVGTVIFIIWAWRRNLFTDETVMKYYLGKFGPGAPFFFIIIQIIQTVVPIIPGALTIPLGIVVFGHVPGFFYNFIGIMIGSVMNYFLAKKYGRPLVRSLVSEKQYQKYIGKLESSEGFKKLFIGSMFFPVTPADFLCYLAGLSNMKFKTFMFALSAGKPFTLLSYSYGLLFIIRIFNTFV
ncbi:TVP38/TMEM64 family protein [Dolosigranulum pigrum]|uniref:TVP38/TMEM64 family protein n=1 Tax=Dolosigranulum pigrum TaxID=29394 RepID=UPI000DC2ABDC|nr:TVP38/TMEM64 family protein [Dolosigranulum pigrum]RAN50707.1 hypothetical protein B8A31_08595 [Dolosigranulum pigrum]RAN56673.1 hypothetical protein B8A40_08740 [Dolosigranulum pigrum]